MRYPLRLAETDAEGERIFQENPNRRVGSRNFHIDLIGDFAKAGFEEKCCATFSSAEDLQRVDSKAEVEWVAHVNELGEQTLFMLADSWYLGANIPGKPCVFMPYTGGMITYRERCDAIAADGYSGFVMNKSYEPRL